MKKLIVIKAVVLLVLVVLVAASCSPRVRYGCTRSRHITRVPMGGW
jgi:hypothetical protein